MLVYRIENENGTGIYGLELAYGNTKSDILDEQCEETILEDFHPGPDFDPGIKKFWKKLDADTRAKYVFGFASVAQMHDWFPPKGLEQMEAQAAAGNSEQTTTMISVYSVPATSAYKGERQVMFFMKDAVLMSRFPLTHYND